MTALPRRLAYAGLAFAFSHVVLGAVLRVTAGSARATGVVDALQGVRGALGAATLAAAAALLAALARRGSPPAGGAEPAAARRAAAFGAVLAAARLILPLAGAGPDWPALDTVVRALDLAVVAALAAAVLRTGGLGADGAARSPMASATPEGATPAAVRALAGVAAAGAFLAAVAAPVTAGGGGPASRAVAAAGIGALALASSLLTVRAAAPRLERAARMALGTVALQGVVAVVLVALDRPAALRTLHDAVGVIVWLSLFLCAELARQVASPVDVAAAEPVPAAIVTPVAAEREEETVPESAAVVAGHEIVEHAENDAPWHADDDVAAPAEATAAELSTSVVASEPAPAEEDVAVYGNAAAEAAYESAAVEVHPIGGGKPAGEAADEPLRAPVVEVTVALFAERQVEVADAVEPGPAAVAAESFIIEDESVAASDEGPAAARESVEVSYSMTSLADGAPVGAEGAVEGGMPGESVVGESAAPAEAAPVRRRPPTLAVLLARGADF